MASPIKINPRFCYLPTKNATSTNSQPPIVEQMYDHGAVQPNLASLIAIIMAESTPNTSQSTTLPLPKNLTHEVCALHAFQQLGHQQCISKEQGLVVTLVLENQTNLLVVMSIGHGKSITLTMPPTITNHIVIMVVPLSILVSGHEVDAW
jgi:hypothetical protein